MVCSQFCKLCGGLTKSIASAAAKPRATISLPHFGFCIRAQARLRARRPRRIKSVYHISHFLLLGARSKIRERYEQESLPMDVIGAPNTGQNAPEFTVSELSGAVKRLVEGEFTHVRVKGEVGRVSRPRSGHVYLDIKDDRAVLAGVMWKDVATRLPTQPEEGMEVVVAGRLTTFPGQSRYQIVIDDIKPTGTGALMALLEKRKAQLTAEGLFDACHKRPLPYLPETIGVVTSLSGAVIRDILHRLRDRFPRKVLIWSVAVQGARCAPEVTRAINGFNAFTPGGVLPRPDLLIVARGGGSVEDLWGFNEESVVRAVAANTIPLISAVGHETDVTLIDYAADQRAPTPTAAAELAVPVRVDLMGWLDAQSGRLTHAASSGVAARHQRLVDLARALPRPDAILDAPRQRFDFVADRLPRALLQGVQARRLTLTEQAGSLRPTTLQRMTRMQRGYLDRTARRLGPARLQDRLTQAKKAFAQMSRRLTCAGTAQIDRLRRQIKVTDHMREMLSYKATLDRGYAVIRAENQVVTTKAEARFAPTLDIEFRDGHLAIGGKLSKLQKKIKDTPDQGSLF